MVKIGRLEFGYWGPWHINFRWEWVFEHKDMGNAIFMRFPPLWARWWRY
jgi:hypothetical protein